MRELNLDRWSSGILKIWLAPARFAQAQEAAPPQYATAAHRVSYVGGEACWRYRASLRRQRICVCWKRLRPDKSHMAGKYHRRAHDRDLAVNLHCRRLYIRL